MEPEMLLHWNLVFTLPSGEWLQSREAAPSRGSWNLVQVAGVGMWEVLVWRQPKLSGCFRGCKNPQDPAAFTGPGKEELDQRAQAKPGSRAQPTAFFTSPDSFPLTCRFNILPDHAMKSSFHCKMFMTEFQHIFFLSSDLSTLAGFRGWPQSTLTETRLLPL